MKDEPPAKRRIRLGKLWWWMVAAFASAIGWQMWELHLYNAAVREAKEAGFTWAYTDSITLIRQDWRNALKKETWGAHDRELHMIGRAVPDLGRYREMLHRLRPTVLHAWGCENVDSLKSLTSLQYLGLSGSPALQNVNGVKGLKSLQWLDLSVCTALQNVDGLEGLANMHTLNLSDCHALQNVDGLMGLTGLQSLDLSVCIALQNVNVLKGLAGLQKLWLNGCEKIPAAALRELRAALPNTDITFPDGTKNPPQ